MALRDLVTGGGGCSVPGGGPQSSSNANPLGALADSFFGSSKTQERIRELPALPGSAPNESLEVGPLTSYPGSEYGRDHIQHSNNQASTSSHAFNYADKARYDDAWHDSTSLQPPPTHFQTPAVPEYFPDFEQIYNERTTAFPPGPESNGTPQKILSHFLRSFLDSSKAEIPFSPTQLPVLGLSEGDKQCIRNRSSIMARHIFAGKSDEYIDTQVNALLQSLEIENDLRGWASGGPRPSDLEEYWNESQSRSYSGLRSTNGGIVGTSNNADRWVAEYGENSNISGSWAEEFEQSHGPQTWAEQFNQDQMQMGNSKSRDLSNAAALEQSRMLAQTLSQNADPKFQNSKFLQFVSKMSRGELSFEGNQVNSATPSTDWANEFQLQHDNQNNSWAAEFQSAEQSNNDGAWATEFETENQRKHDTDEQWIDEFSKLHVQDWGDEYVSADSWADSYEKYVEEQLKGEHQLQSSSRYAYIFADKNPYVGQPNPLKEGQELFRKGLLSEAVLALEAEVLKNPENSEGWRLLGIAHAENDDDQQAIAAMVRARDADPINLEVLLALGVSHTNELEQAAALGYLKSWLQNNPNYGVLVPRDHPENLSHVEVVRLFNEAAQMSPGDGDIHTVLGVLYNLSREYDKAISAFQTALKIKPQDYSLWNKLGATQANSAQSADALYAYQQALDLKPNYVRAWANMGISFANQGRYEESIHYYVRALSMNPNAENAWQYLRISLSCASRNDLLEACDVRDLDKLQKEFPL